MNFRQWFRQRSRYRTDRSFEAYIRKVSEIEGLATGLEGDARRRAIELERLHGELARLKSEALGLFTRGEIQSAELISGFLTHVNDARTHLTGAILRLKDEGAPLPKEP